MSFLELLFLLVIAGVCGSIARALVGFSRGGCLISIVVGFVGALLGNWIAREMNLPEFFTVTAGDTQFPVVWAIIGAVLFTSVLNLISSNKK